MNECYAELSHLAPVRSRGVNVLFILLIFVRFGHTLNARFQIMARQPIARVPEAGYGIS